MMGQTGQVFSLFRPSRLPPRPHKLLFPVLVAILFPVLSELPAQHISRPSRARDLVTMAEVGSGRVPLPCLSRWSVPSLSNSRRKLTKIGSLIAVNI